jgi:predicted Zn-dependent peptidase
LTRAANGLRVITEQIDDAHTVAVGCYVGVGTRDEAAASVGASHFLEHLLFKGTATRTAREIAEVVDSTGGDMNAYTTKEYTAFYLRVPARHLEAGIELLCDVVTAPAFRDPEFESERQVILEELHLQQDEPDDLVHTVLYETLFPDHPLGWEIVGHERSIKAMTPRSVRGFHQRWYVPTNMVFAAAGPVVHRQFAAAVLRHLGRLPDGHAPRRRRPRARPLPRRIVSRAGEAAHVSFGWRAVDHNDPDRYALALVNQIVGGGMSSRLFQTIREDHGLAYSIFSSTASFSDTGVFSIYVGTTPESTPVVVRHTREIVGDVVANGVSDHELEVAKNAFEGATVMNLEDTGSRMARLGTSVITRGTVTPLDRYLAAVRRVSRRDTQRVAASILGTIPTVAAVGPVRARSVRW